MALAKHITVQEAAQYMSLHERRIRERIEAGELPAIAIEGARGGNRGKSYLVDISNLPIEAQLRYLAQMDSTNIGAADIVSYRERFGDQGLKTVLARYNAVLQCKLIEQDNRGNVTNRKKTLAAGQGVTMRTLYRWRDAYATHGLAGLMDKMEQSNKGKPKTICLFAQDFIKANLYKAAKYSNKSVYVKLQALDRELGCLACARCPHCDGSLARRELALQGVASEYALCDRPGEGLVIPGNVSNFNRYVATIPEDQLAYARNGRRYWEARYMPKAQRMKPAKVNECWFGDHHMFDLFVIDEDGKIVRPWMTAWSDAASGCFVGWCISTNPNGNTIAETFVRAIAPTVGSPFMGVPAAIYIDNGKDYRSKRFEGDRETEHVIGRLNEQLDQTAILQILGVSVIHAQPYKAWSKTIERLFGTLEGRYIRDLPGWCGGRPELRPENLTRATLEKMAARGKLLTFRQFAQIMREQIIPAYHGERFEQLQSPLEIYQAGEKSRTDMPDWDVLGLIRTEAVKRKVSYMGVKLHNQWYWDDALRHMAGQEVTVRYSKADDISVTIIQGKRYICEAGLKDKLKLINESPDKIAAHMALQQRTRNEVRAGIAHAQRAVDIALKNVEYEPIDVCTVAPGTITTTEYRKAAKGKVAKREELKAYTKRDREEDAAVTDTVRAMFAAMGRGNKTHD